MCCLNVAVDLCRIVLVRLAQEGEEGKFLYTEMVKHMWKDVDIKSKKLAVCDVCCSLYRGHSKSS